MLVDTASAGMVALCNRWERALVYRVEGGRGNIRAAKLELGYHALQEITPSPNLLGMLDKPWDRRTSAHKGFCLIHFHPLGSHAEHGFMGGSLVAGNVGGSASQG